LLFFQRVQQAVGGAFAVPQGARYITKGWRVLARRYVIQKGDGPADSWRFVADVFVVRVHSHEQMMKPIGIIVNNKRSNFPQSPSKAFSPAEKPAMIC
jgi:hypothetical protein